MRKALTLNDVAKHLRRELRRFGASLKACVNPLLRLGLVAFGKPSAKSFVVNPRPLGLPPGVSYDQVEDLVEALESPLHR